MVILYADEQQEKRLIKAWAKTFHCSEDDLKKNKVYQRLYDLSDAEMTELQHFKSRPDNVTTETFTINFACSTTIRGCDTKAIITPMFFVAMKQFNSMNDMLQAGGRVGRFGTTTGGR